MASPLEIRVLGELAVVRGARLLALPASKKTRALLGYLVVCAQPQPRQRLCEFFWDGPDDPRAALRWSLSKLRPVVDDDEHARLVADRDHVAFHPHGAPIDLESVVETARDAKSASLEALKAAAELPTGELLEGLDLPECYRYHEWCVAERETARRARITILGTHVDRFADDCAPRRRGKEAIMAN
jgi:DNA-binding SARP family transcriptional activator